VGYRVDFSLFDRHLYVNPQVAFGFGLYASNKPEASKQRRGATASSSPLWCFSGSSCEPSPCRPEEGEST
jgi:hypothetical protein